MDNYKMEKLDVTNQTTISYDSCTFANNNILSVISNILLISCTRPSNIVSRSNILPYLCPYFDTIYY